MHSVVYGFEINTQEAQAFRGTHPSEILIFESAFNSYIQACF